jgi:hypothetical protein
MTIKKRPMWNPWLGVPTVVLVFKLPHHLNGKVPILPYLIGKNI